MNFYKFHLAGIVLLVAMFSGCKPPVFFHGVKTEKKPWSHTKFYNNPDNFQFAIVADRTGGARKSVFSEAARKLNLLRPEFVLSVGDLITGYTTDKNVARKQWNKINHSINYFNMPFFYVNGNHDITNKELGEVWKDLYGVTYYYFIYKDVLFICLDTQEDLAGLDKKNISSAQIKWAKGVLLNHPDVRWTILFMHKPLWLDEKDFIDSYGKKHPGNSTGFKEIEDALQGRDYTVFAGHFHKYTKYIRKDKKYFILATTGGASSLQGPTFGEFDHVVWVTMTPKGPVIANLMIDGIYDENVTTEKTREKLTNNVAFEKGLKFILNEKTVTKEKFQFLLPVKNKFKHNLHYNISWKDADSCWQITPEQLGGIIAPGQDEKLYFKAVLTKKTGPLECNVKFVSGDDLEVKKELNSYKILRQLNRPTLDAVLVAKAPKIDGKLDDGAWSIAKPVLEFRTNKDKEVTAKTEAFFAYAKDNLYIAFKCNEPNIKDIKTAVKDHDGPVWEDDSVEVFIDTNLDRKTYYQIIANSAGVVLDAVGYDKSVDFDPVVATRKDKDSWSVEIAIPWKNIKTVKPELGQKMGVGLVRSRNIPGEVQQFPVLYGNNHQPEMFGDILFKK